MGHLQLSYPLTSLFALRASERLFFHAGGGLLGDREKEKKGNRRRKRTRERWKSQGGAFVFRPEPKAQANVRIFAYVGALA